MTPQVNPTSKPTKAKSKPGIVVGKKPLTPHGLSTTYVAKRVILD